MNRETFYFNLTLKEVKYYLSANSAQTRSVIKLR